MIDLFMCILLARCMLSGHSFSHNFLKCTYIDFFSLCIFRYLLSTHVTATKINEQTRNIFIFICIPAYFYAAITNMLT